ncbi:hypothetical protein BZA77DRAFT_166824 [Pyronema omphalodes]|nr:hypothetical protein BZA77DRAFT_166824 [Pyronema omphalodes]
MGLGVMGLWGYGVMGLWGYGVMGLWGYGVMGLWGYGVMGLWGYGVMGLRGYGVLCCVLCAGCWVLGAVCLCSCAVNISDISYRIYIYNGITNGITIYGYCMVIVCMAM